MPANTRLGLGGHKNLSMNSAGASNAACAKSFVPRAVLSRMLRDILKPTCFIARDAASVLGSAGQRSLPWLRRRNDGQEGRYRGFSGRCRRCQAG